MAAQSEALWVWAAVRTLEERPAHSGRQCRDTAVKPVPTMPIWCPVTSQAALRYAFKMDNDLKATPPVPTAEHQGEGGAFWRVIAPVLHGLAPAAADVVSSFYSMTNAPAGTFHYCPTERMLTGNLPKGMTEAADFGKLEGTSNEVCTFPPPPPPAKATTDLGAKAMGRSAG